MGKREGGDRDGRDGAALTRYLLWHIEDSGWARALLPWTKDRSWWRAEELTRFLNLEINQGLAFRVETI